MRLMIKKGDKFACYPFEGVVPVRLLASYPRYLVLEVLPHENNGHISMPYTITVDRRDLETGVAKLRL